MSRSLLILTLLMLFYGTDSFAQDGIVITKANLTLVVKNEDTAQKLNIRFSAGYDSMVVLDPGQQTSPLKMDRSIPRRGGYTIYSGSERFVASTDFQAGYIMRGDWILILHYDRKIRNWRTILREYKEDIDGPEKH